MGFMDIHQKPLNQEVEYEIEDHLIYGKQKTWKKIIEWILTILGWVVILSYISYLIYGSLAIKFDWYLVYWDDNGKQGSFRVYFADYESTYLIADVPNIAHHFKFARIEAGTNIDTALANEWKGVKNQNELDGITFKEENETERIKYLDVANGYNLIKWKL